MHEKNTLKYFLFALLIGAACFAAAAFAPLMLVMAAAAVAAIYVLWGGAFALIPYAAAMVTLMLVTDWTAASFMPMLLFGFGTPFLALGLKKRMPYRYIALVLFAASVVTVYLGLSLNYILEGKPPYEGVVQAISSLTEAYAQYGYDTSELTSAIGSVSFVYYGAIIAFSELMSFGAVMLARLFARKAPTIRPMARFIEWQLPWHLKIGLPVLALGVVVLYIAGFGGAQTMLYTLAYMLLPLFAATGLATMIYIAARSGGRGGLFIGLAIALIMLSPLIAAGMGVIDMYAGIRLKLMRADRLIREAFERARSENRKTVTVDLGDGNGPQVIAVRRELNDEAFFDDDIDDIIKKDDDESAADGGSPENGAQNDYEDDEQDKSGGDAPSDEK